jgi:nicotinate phosphoribosyltransferase
MAFDSELEAFAAYAAAMPHNALLLVDTYNTLEGIRHAIEIGQQLRTRGYDLGGIRLDSGDLAWLSIRAREMLDSAGFTRASIVASNDLDEHLIESLKHQGAMIDVWGVGTRLVTGYDQSTLGGVYKLGAIRRADGTWIPKLKLSEQIAKVSTPGIHQVRRFFDAHEFQGDAIYDLTLGVPTPLTIVDPLDVTKRKTFVANTPYEDLLVPVIRQGASVYPPLTLPDIQKRTLHQIEMIHPGIKRFENPHTYPVGLELGLHNFKIELVLKARGATATRDSAISS